MEYECSRFRIFLYRSNICNSFCFATRDKAESACDYNLLDPFTKIAWFDSYRGIHRTIVYKISFRKFIGVWTYTHIQKCNWWFEQNKEKINVSSFKCSFWVTVRFSKNIRFVRQLFGSVRQYLNAVKVKRLKSESFCSSWKEVYSEDG